jgi:hypothetical protein
VYQRFDVRLHAVDVELKWPTEFEVIVEMEFEHV